MPTIAEVQGGSTPTTQCDRRGALAVAALHRYRRAWPFAVPAVLAALAYTLVAWFGGMMSITNTWL